MALISLRIRSHVKVSIVLTRAGHIFIHKYIGSLLNIMLRPILIVWTGTTACVSDTLANRATHAV